VDLRINDAPVQIRGDAKCVIDQMIGSASVSSPLTVELHQRARKLAGQFNHLTWSWVPRRENRQADSLSRRSFRYISNSSCLDQEINQPQLPSLYGGRLVPLVDLRVHYSVW
jgi:ribonuclease H / adenosylcobalamin/alpha-ribazole phosphatase